MFRNNYIAGQKLGELIFLNRVDSPAGRPMANFRCDCGKEFVTRIESAKNCSTKSCGCKTKELVSKAFTKHGHTPAHGKKSPEYLSWQAMWNRCTNPNNEKFERYKELGVTICEKWETFEGFLSDMGLKKNSSYTIERINNRKGYYKENCKWGTKKEQARNKENTTFIEYKGANKSTAEWAEIIGFTLATLYNRIKLGWDIERAFTQPSKGVYPKPILVTKNN